MTSGDGSSVSPVNPQDWLSYLRDAADQRAKNAFVMLNLSSEGTPRSSTPTCILNSVGFSYPVVYSFLPPGSYKSWANDEAREIKQLVFHSFGHPWHAYQNNGEWQGRMNEPGKITPMPFLKGSAEKLAWVPDGSNMDTMAHQDRIGTTLRALLNASEGTVGTHFLIDRDGLLYVMCDCNHILKSSGALSDTCVSIALEEALYQEASPGGIYEYPFTWDPSGTSNLQAWDYSEQQYITLTQLLFKLRLAYPALNTQTHTTSRTADASFTGYTMHGHLKDARPSDIDIAPHLQTEEEWTALFTAIGQQSSLAAYSPWKRPTEGPAARTAWVEALIEASAGDPSTSNPWNPSNPALTTLAAAHRAHQEVLKTSKDYRRSAALLARNDSKLQEAKLSVGRIVEASDQAKIPMPAKKQLYTDKDYTVAEQRKTAVATDGIF